MNSARRRAREGRPRLVPDDGQILRRHDGSCARGSDPAVVHTPRPPACRARATGPASVAPARQPAAVQEAVAYGARPDRGPRSTSITSAHSSGCASRSTAAALRHSWTSYRAWRSDGTRWTLTIRPQSSFGIGSDRAPQTAADGQCCCAIWPARRSGAAIRTLALTYVEMALVRADRLTATERAMASTVRGRPRPHPWRFQLSCSASPMMMPSGPRRKQSR
jgi:hypothetical protein